MSLEYLTTPHHLSSSLYSPMSSIDTNITSLSTATWMIEDIMAQSSFMYAFLSSLILVFLSEFGDKTFIATVLMTMEYNKDTTTSTTTKTTKTNNNHIRHGLTILMATNLACACIAIVTSLFSYVTLSWLEISPHYIVHISTTACIIFGIQILYDTWVKKDEEEDVKETSAIATPTPTHSRRLSLPPTITPATPLSTIFYRTFFWSLMTELGDRSQLGMMMLSSQQHLNVYGILCGGILGHILCTVVAIVFGECSSSYISPKWMATAGGVLFLVLAVYGV